MLSEAAAVCPLLEADSPKGRLWFTAVNDTAPPTTCAAFASVATTFAVPEGGASKYQTSMRFWFPGPFWTRRRFSGWPP